MSLGLQLGQGIPRADCFDGQPVVVEGEANARSVIDLARRIGVVMPISQTVHAVLHEGADLAQTFSALVVSSPSRRSRAPWSLPFLRMQVRSIPSTSRSKAVMNARTETALPPLSARRFTLATDLDGTFLGGTDRERATLYDWIESNRESIGLIFCDGPRSGVHPQHVRGEGASLARARRGRCGHHDCHGSPRRPVVVEPIDELEQDIAARWQDSGERVRETPARPIRA